ncbi:Mor transcription activator family protein [Desulforamulus putei DSM 12395]|uniref:Mor transcription activator family protein n=1 Tax=Desulforamulus putei DSM 12395 TaxID=1121429 RepID=A0A1M5BT97_9FIRM|nr:Mor transcription activator family protein [Desulforamulus putei]SHF45497.1 Mor transcription activator family protein [Desulforamulus putei DSM 12395]
MDGLIDELTPEMIPQGIYRDIVEKIGVANFIKLAELVGGATIYIPKAESFLRPARDLRIKQEFNGYNHAELAKRYNLSERWIRAICGEGHAEGQISLFDLDYSQEENTEEIKESATA